MLVPTQMAKEVCINKIAALDEAIHERTKGNNTNESLIDMLISIKRDYQRKYDELGGK
jgi:hypothetical protein